MKLTKSALVNIFTIFLNYFEEIMVRWSWTQWIRTRMDPVCCCSSLIRIRMDPL
jgi:hypothetical protein